MVSAQKGGGATARAGGRRRRAATVSPGETVAIYTDDAFESQITKANDKPSEILGSYLNPQTGPIYIEGAEPGDRQRPLLGITCPEALDALQHLDVPAAHLAGDRLQHLAAAQRVGGRGAADDERLPPHRRRRLFQEHLRQRPAARVNRVAVEQRQGAHDFRRADVEAHRCPVANRPFHVGQAVQANRERA